MIRRAENRDVGALKRLLGQVLEVHAKIRPDVFVSGTTKYSEDELVGIIANDRTPIFVCDEGGEVIGYAFCQASDVSGENLVTKKSLYIDDLCVDEAARGKRVGERLYRAVVDYAESIGCDEITLNVWEGNDGARRFYEKMGMKVRKTTMEVTL